MRYRKGIMLFKISETLQTGKKIFGWSWLLSLNLFSGCTSVSLHEGVPTATAAWASTPCCNGYKRNTAGTQILHTYTVSPMLGAVRITCAIL